MAAETSTLHERVGERHAALTDMLIQSRPEIKGISIEIFP